MPTKEGHKVMLPESDVTAQAPAWTPEPGPCTECTRDVTWAYGLHICHFLTKH